MLKLTVVTVRKPRKIREIHDSVQILYEKVLAGSKEFANVADRVQADQEAKAILDRENGDTQTNRLAMLRLWLDVRNWMAGEATQVAKKIRALAEYEALIAPAMEGWKAANDAWMKYVQAENAKGHNGQKAAAGEFWSDFAHLEPLVLKPRGTEEVVAELVAKLEDLTFRVRNFVWSHWCTTCGAPVDEINIVGKKPFWPKLCGTCFHKPVATNMPAGKKNGKPVLEFRAEPLSADEIKANRVAARTLNEVNRLVKKNKRRTNAEASAEASQNGSNCKDGAAKTIRKAEKEARKQGGHPEEEKKKATKKKSALKGK